MATHTFAETILALETNAPEAWHSLRVKVLLCLVFAGSVCTLGSCTAEKRSSGNAGNITGDYLGQTPPGDSAILFSPGIVSSGLNDRDFAVTPDGTEIFFSQEAGNFTYTTIFHSRRVKDKWSVPEVFEYCTDPAYKYIEPHISPDGNTLYFVSNKPYDSTIVGNTDIWFSQKLKDGWGKPKNIGPPVNTKGTEYFPSVIDDRTIYYTHYDSTAKDEFIYRSRYENGIYQEPEKLGPNVNIGNARYNAFVAADESYIIIPAYGMPDSYGGTDYYISFRDSSGNWSKPVNMGPEINTSNPREWSASVTADRKYLFFMSARMGNNKLETLSSGSLQKFFNSPQNGNTDIYWISASIIEDLRKKAQY